MSHYSAKATSVQPEEEDLWLKNNSNPRQFRTLETAKKLEAHRIWIWIRPDTNILGSGKIRIRPDTNSLDPVNWIHYHVVVPITVSMHYVLSPNVRKV